MKPGACILIVDDDPATRDLVQIALEDAGYQVRCAENGARALLEIIHTVPSLIVLDLVMPVMNGWELLEILRQHPRSRRIPIIVVTGTPVGAPKGASMVIEKPFAMTLLLRAIEGFD